MATREYYADLDMRLNQIKNVVVEKLSTLPTFSAAEQGRIVSVGGALYINNGTEWKALATGGDTEEIRTELTALENKVGTTAITGDSVTAAIATAQSDISGIKSDLDTATTGLKARMTQAESDIDTLEGKVGADTDTASATGTLYARTKQNAADIGTKVDKVTGKSLIDDSEITRLAGIETGAQVNVIETVKVNNVALTPASKAVNIDLSEYAKKTEISSALNYKGSVDNVGDLPASGNTVGDVYNVRNAFNYGTPSKMYPAGTNVAWDGSAWDPLGGTVDLSVYYTKTESDNRYEPTLTGNRAAAADSGITVAKVAAYDAYDAEIDGKVDKLATKPTAGTYTKVAINGEGQVTSGDTLAVSDIPTGIPQANITDLTSDLAGKVPKIASATGAKLVKSNSDGTIAEDADATTKLAGIAAGAQVNVIETVKVNGTAQSVTDKAIDISVPTKITDLTDDSDFQDSTEVATAINTAKADYYNKTDLNAQYGEAELTFNNGTATASVANVWAAQVLTSSDVVVYCDVTIGANSVVVNINGAAPTGGLKLRYIKKPAVSA